MSFKGLIHKSETKEKISRSISEFRKSNKNWYCEFVVCQHCNRNYNKPNYIKHLPCRYEWQYIPKRKAR